MIVCSCNVLSDHKIRDVVTSAGSQSLTARQVYGCLGCRMQCGRCARAIKRILNEALADCAGGRTFDQLTGLTFHRPRLQ
jgi:bacterioferritin-associated ferredoxin